MVMKYLAILALCIIAFAPAVQAQASLPELSVVMTRYDPFPAETGKYMTLWIKVQNMGPVSAKNVTLELLDTYPFSLDASEDRAKTFGEVLPTEPVLVEYRVRVNNDALDGRNPIDLKVSTNGRDFFVESFDINVESKAIDFAIGSLLSEPERLVSDSENSKLTLSLQNIGESTAKLVRAELMLPDGFTPSESYSDEYSVGNIEAESSGNAIFYIDIDKSVDTGEHLGTLKVFYKDGNDDEYRRKTLQVRIPVRSSPLFDITGMETVPQEIGQGMQNVELRLDVMNSGSREAENVNIRVLKEATQPFDFDEKSNFVGNLGPNETGQAVFHFDVDGTANLKKYIMDIEIRYTTDSTVNIANERISFEVTKRLPDPTGMYIMIIIFLVVVGLIAWYIRK
jgi:hypothetical protein